MAASVSEKTEERKNQVMLGELPEDFLRISKSPSQQQIIADEQAAILLQQQLTSNFYPSNVVGRLQITVAQAMLIKNYGMTRMDPYVRLRVGHMVFETNADYNGAKSPKWNKILTFYLPQGVDSVSIEIYDECAFKMDEKIAWTKITIPDRVLKENETIDDWYPLSGKQGIEKEGSINVILSYSPISAQVSPGYHPYFMAPSPLYGAPVTAYPTNPGIVTHNNQVPTSQICNRPVQIQPVNEDDIKQVSEMFPNVEKEVIKSVLEAQNGNKDAAINALLSMSP